MSNLNAIQELLMLANKSHLQVSSFMSSFNNMHKNITVSLYAVMETWPFDLRFIFMITLCPICSQILDYRYVIAIDLRKSFYTLSLTNLVHSLDAVGSIKIHTIYNLMYFESDPIRLFCLVELNLDLVLN